MDLKSCSSGRLLRSGSILALAAGAVLFPSLALAQGSSLPAPESMTLAADLQQDPNPHASEATTAESRDEPVYMDVAPVEKPEIHGFFSSPFKTSYVTPRGLVVENGGVVWQPIVGLIFPIGDFGVVKKTGVIAGIWNSVNSAQDDPNVGAWNEMDVFVSLTGDIDKFNLTLTYGDWNFPTSTTAKPSTQHNIDLKITYDDSEFWDKKFAIKKFAVKPYVDIFWAVAGSSTVVLGREGDTGYVEIGITPTYTLDAITNYPITFTMPVYISVGPEHYWGADDPDGNFGVFSAGLNASMPLSFIPTRLGFWHVDAGVTYYYLKNDNLLNAGTIVSGNTDRNVVQGSLGVGVNF